MFSMVKNDERCARARELVSSGARVRIANAQCGFWSNVYFERRYAKERVLNRGAKRTTVAGHAMCSANTIPCVFFFVCAVPGRKLLRGNHVRNKKRNAVHLAISRLRIFKPFTYETTHATELSSSTQQTTQRVIEIVSIAKEHFCGWINSTQRTKSINGVYV